MGQTNVTKEEMEEQAQFTVTNTTKNDDKTQPRVNYQNKETRRRKEKTIEN